VPATVEINRAPVLTLWAAVVGERMGLDADAALSVGRAVAGLNAQSKGRRLGLFQPKDAGKKPAGERFAVAMCGRAVPVAVTPDGLRAVSGGKPVEPEAVESYLDAKFGDALPTVRSAMKRLATSYAPAELAEVAYPLYESFRPSVPAGKKGWGAKGVLDLGLLGQLRRNKGKSRR
jgi:hypothetical protein